MITRSKTTNKQQALFADTEQFLCKCGCGQYGFRRATGRKREYINPTHKKRAQRARRKTDIDGTRYLLTEKGREAARRLAKRDYSSLWENFSEEEKWVIHLASQHPQGYEGFWRAVLAITKRQDSWWSINVSGAGDDYRGD